MKKLIADFAEYDCIEVKNGNTFIEWTAEEFEKHMAWIEQETIKEIRDVGVSIYAKYVEDEEIAKHMETLVKFKLEQMFTAVEDLRIEREAHQALREKLKEIEWSASSFDPGFCPVCEAMQHVEIHKPDCWLAQEINK